MLYTLSSSSTRNGSINATMDLRVLQNASASDNKAGLLAERFNRAVDDNPHILANADINYLSCAAKPVSKGIQLPSSLLTAVFCIAMLL